MPAAGGFDMNQFMNLIKMMGLGSGAGMAAGGAMNYFNAGKNNPSDAAKPYLDQIPGIGKEYLGGYSDAGKGAMDSLTGQYNNLLNDTGSVYNKLAGGYQESPGFKYKMDTAMNAGNNAQAAGGMLGTPQHQQMNADVATGLASKDFGDYMNNQMNLYGQGLSGQQGMMNQGFNASQSLADMLASAMTQQGQNAFTGQANTNASKSQGMGGMMEGLMKILPFLFM